MRITLFNNKNDNVPQHKECTWERLAEWLTNFKEMNDKNGLAYSIVEYYRANELKFDCMKNGKSHFIDEKTGEEFIGNKDKVITRSGKNVKTVYALVYDIDGQMPYKVARGKLKNIKCVFYSTWGNGSFKLDDNKNPIGDPITKFRIIIPLKNPIAVTEFKDYWNTAIDQLQIVVDPSPSNAGSFFFAPCYNSMNKDIRFSHIEEGDFLNIVPKEVKVKSQGRPTNYGDYNTRGDYTTLDIVAWFKSKNMYLGPTDNPNKHFVECPWRHNHTDNIQNPTDTNIYDDTNDRKWATFSCAHGHCKGKNIQSLMEEWGDQDKFCTEKFDKAVPEPDALKKPEPPRENSGELVQIKCLGVDDTQRYWYQSSITSMVVPLPVQQHNEKGFYSIIANEDFWKSNYGTETKKGFVTDWKWAAVDMMSKCQDVGSYDPVEVRGTGVWVDKNYNEDKKRVVVHLGKSLLVGNQIVKLTEWNGEFNYEPKSKIIRTVKYAQEDRSAALKDIINRLPIESKIDRVLLLGALIIGPICGALSWRPHIWLIGEAGSGKSTIMDKIVKRMWGPPGGLIVEGGSTEAGVRQKIKNNAVPVIIDEMEGMGQKDIERIQAIISTVRSSSSDNDAEVLKGTTTGKGVAFRVKSMFMLGSISHSLKHNQDKDRFSVIRAIKSEPHQEVWPQFEKDIEELLTEEYALAMFYRTIKMIPIIKKNIENLKLIMVEDGNSRRWADQHAPLIGGALSVGKDEPLSMQDLIDTYDAMGGKKVDGRNEWDKYKEERISSTQDCVYRMLTGKIWDGNKPKSLYELICEARAFMESGNTENQNRAQAVLKEKGFKIKSKPNSSGQMEYYLHVASASFWPTQSFFDSVNVVSYWDLMKNLDNTDTTSKIKFIGEPVNCLTIPFKSIHIDVNKVKE
jgi:hypothetical protein